ncbi:hypothetical protein D3C83_306400 [compost metagenome]
MLSASTITTPPELVSVNAELVADAKPIAFAWTGEKWEAAPAPGAAPAAKR